MQAQACPESGTGMGLSFLLPEPKPYSNEKVSHPIYYDLPEVWNASSGLEGKR